MIKRPLLALLLAGTLLPVASTREAVAADVVAAAAGDALPPEQVFTVDASRGADGGIDLRFGIRDGYYLYRERIAATADPAADVAPALTLPAGKVKEDPNFGKVEVYRGDTAAQLSGGPAGEWTLALRYQGCADAGLCYPPQTARFRVTPTTVTPVGVGLAALTRPPGGTSTSSPARPGAPGASLAASGSMTGATLLGPAASAGGEDEAERVARALFSDSLPLILLAFFGAGLLLALTPCMLPMVPILSGIIVGQRRAGQRLPGQGGADHGQNSSTGAAGSAVGAAVRSTATDRRRAFTLSLAYVLAMAVTYALAGVAAGLSGVLFSSLLQQPWVVSGFALVFVALALSMFGLFDLQLPSALQTWAGELSNQVPGGRHGGAAVMGSLSALIVGPCVAPPLAGALLFISRSGDVWLGGSALFVLALGMGVPLMFVGTSAGHLLGQVNVRANAWYGRIRAVFGVLLLGVAAWVSQPAWLPVWDRLAGSDRAARSDFENVASLEALRTVLRDSGGQPVLIDFTADWCTTCRELDRLTFADAKVAERLSHWRRLRFDVTASSSADREALSAFGLYGPPAVLLFDADGVERREQRVLNFQAPQAFLISLDRVEESH
jgi:thiol:disulfide interchange protein DsbD